MTTWPPPRSCLVECFCVDFPRFVGIYGWLFVGISFPFLTLASTTSVSYRIVIFQSVSRYVSSAYSYRCTDTTMNRFTPNRNVTVIGSNVSKWNYIWKRNTLLCNTSRQRENCQHFADNIFKCVSMNENLWVLDKFSLKYIPWGLVDNMAALVQIIAWHQSGDRQLSAVMMVMFCWHIYASLGLSDLRVNPLRAKFFRGNINIYLHFVSFLHIGMAQVVEILPQVRQEPTYST